jgi:type 2 lantibiotic biosynthesis protein LanM
MGSEQVKWDQSIVPTWTSSERLLGFGVNPEVCMRQIQSDKPSESGSAALDERLRREGWSLHQRLAWIVTQAPPLHSSKDADVLADWRRVVAPDNSTNFFKRLAWDELTEAHAIWALDPDTSAIPQEPEWWPLLLALRQAARSSHAGETKGFQERGTKQPFVHLWRPAAAWALGALKSRCAVLEPKLRLRDAAWLDLGEALLERYCNLTDRALWVLFNQRRTPGQVLLAHLRAAGDGSVGMLHEAYDAFVADLLSNGYSLLLAEYPVLGRLLAVATQQWLEGCEEMLLRLADSRRELEQYFAIPTTEPLLSVQLGLSDPHRGGRVVAILCFGDENANGRVVYKPKDMQVDMTYQRMLRTLNDASSLPPLRCITVLSRENYGFMEWVKHRPCGSAEELCHFYTNAGRTMAMLHLLGCTDCHFENLIASGDQFVLIDTETLLEADLRDLISDIDNEPDSFSEIQSSIKGSVLRSGLLPQWLFVGAGQRRRAIDISALGIEPPPPQREQPGWLGLNSDGMIFGKVIQPCVLPTSLPVPLGSAQRLTDHLEELCAGFHAQLQEAIRLRHLLLGMLADFSGQPRRLVARDTKLYSAIQRQMLEPSSLRNAVVHGLRLEQLSRSFVLAKEKPLIWQMFQAEILQMESLDIPFFEHKLDSEDLPLPAGLAPIPRFMKTSGLDAAFRRLEEFDRTECDFQLQLIRGAIAARQFQTIRVAEQGLNSMTTYGGSADSAQAVHRDRYRQEAFRLAEEIWGAAIRDRKGRPEWLGIDHGSDGESFCFGLIGNALYSGSSGIGMLFARLSMASDGELAERWRNRAWSCIQGLAELAERDENDELFRQVRDWPYGIAGSGGILLVLQLMQQAGFAEALRLSELLVAQLRPERLMSDEGIDVMGGIAGLIGPLLLSGQPRAQELAVVCGDRLLKLQADSGGWRSGAGPANHRKPPLTGFAHGAAGMAAALARLAHVTGVRRFADGVMQAVAYERSVFVAERSNWPDFRKSSKPDSFMLSWCHGAPGILLSRLVLDDCELASDITRSDIVFARQSTIEACGHAARNDHYPSNLCCGILGLTSLLRVDAMFSERVLSSSLLAAERALITQAQANGGYIIHNIDKGSLNLPGFFTGKAGVALALLEAGESLHWLPSILSAGLLNISRHN